MSTGPSEASRGPRLGRLRAVVAAAELTVAVVLAALAVQCWHRGAVMVRYPVDDTPQWLTLVDGRWLAAAVGAATLGALLVLDAGRQLVLAVRTGPRSPPGLTLRPCKQLSGPDGPAGAGTASLGHSEA